MEFLPLNKWIPNLKKPLVIAGPCSAETEEQILTTAHALKNIEDVRILRAGVWKPRTRPGTFEGVGTKALAWMAKAKEETGLLTCVEVATPSHVEKALEFGIDILWIGARTSVNPFAVQEIADSLKGTNIPIMVKNPINADLSLWMGAIERIHNAGINKLAAIHRGFSTLDEPRYRNRPFWRIPIELKHKLPGLPVICDPSHIAGDRNLIAEVSQKAMDVDMDGLMIETHPNPDAAWSDAKQQVTPSSLSDIVGGLSLRTEFSPNRGFESALEGLRDQIDRVDNILLESLKSRMEIVEKIGAAKSSNDVTPLQIHRMEKMMKSRLEIAKQLGLPEKYVKEIYEIIHVESVKRQTQIMNTFQTDKESE
ncbi:MAG: bifunctional 3-deoxy-7-phosphoheptulonate synthase/chorismate mutase type II [Bacteriovoracaceae bacterium]|nr:bifunctional 3-deoxy-7-phosphoheptulonate synthase/chorismate mutase type II [Bacteriovoracaceae bacterium]